MNKKGDIPTMVLVIGVFVICIVAIISFKLSSDNFKAGFETSQMVEYVNSISEKVIFYNLNNKDPINEIEKTIPMTNLEVVESNNLYSITYNYTRAKKEILIINYTFHK